MQGRHQGRADVTEADDCNMCFTTRQRFDVGQFLDFQCWPSESGRCRQTAVLRRHRM